MRKFSYRNKELGLTGDPEGYATLRNLQLQQLPFLPDRVVESDKYDASDARVSQFYYAVPEFIRDAVCSTDLEDMGICTRIL
jgi:hypothetical protein